MPAHTDSVAHRARAGMPIRVRCRTRWHCLRAVAAAAALGCLTVAPSAGAAQVDVASNGRGAVSTAPTLQLGADESADCTGGVPASEEEPRWCRFIAPDGAAVTFTASPGATPDATGTRFVGWSDSRCPPTPSCTMTIDDAHISLTALFSPQDVLVKASGTGTVTAPAADPCPILDSGIFTGRLGCGTYAFGTDVTLRASGTDARWDADACDATGTDSAGRATCQVSAVE